MRRLLFQEIARHALMESAPLADDAGRVHAALALRLGRSLAIREIDAGSCNGCELEIHALNTPLTSNGSASRSSPRRVMPTC